MPIHIMKRAQRTRCYKCGSIDVEAVCHHCGKAMCASHVRKVVDNQGKLLSVEFVGLGLKDTVCGEIPIHCEYCYHLVRSPNFAPIIAGVLILILALWLPLDGSAKFLGVLIGGGLGGLAYYINKKRSEELMRSKPDLPLLPRFRTIQMRETVHGQINLNSNGEYTVNIPSVEGALNITSNFGKPERDQLESYRKKYRITEDQDVQFNAGFATFLGSSGVDFSDRAMDDNSTVLVLTDQVKSQPFLKNVESRVSGEWHKTKKYNPVGARTNILPVRIVPSLIQEAAQRALDLEIQWTERNSGTDRLTVHKIDHLELRVPMTWGQIENITDSAIIGQASNTDNSNAMKTITWNDLTIKDSERKGNYSASGMTKLGRSGVPAKASLKASSALTPFLRAVER